MQKLGLILVAVLAILLLGGPYATGSMTETRLTERIDQMGENAFVIAEVADYERGWLKSTSRIEFGISPEYFEQMGAIADSPVLPEVFAQRIAILIEIEHGPVVFADGIHVGLARVTARPDPSSPLLSTIVERYGIPYLFEFRGRAGFGQRFEFDADVPPVDYAGPEGEILFSGLDIEGSVTGNHVTTRGLTQEFSFQNPFVSSILEALAFEFDYEIREDFLPLSSGRISVDSFTTASPVLGGEPLFALQNLGMSSALALGAGGEDLDAEVVYSIGSMAAGEEFAVSDASVGITIGGIDAAAAADYYTLLQQMSAGGQTDPDLLMTELMSLGERVVRRGLRIAADPIRFSMPEGALDGRIVVDIDGSSLPPGQPIDLRNIAVLLGVISASAELSVEKPLAERLAALAIEAQLAAGGDAQGGSPEDLADMAAAQAGFMLVGLVGQGILIDDGDAYSTEISFDDSGATVNGAPMPFGLL